MQDLRLHILKTERRGSALKFDSPAPSIIFAEIGILQGAGQGLGLAEEVLALHDAIREVTIVENRAGELHVTDRAGRNDRPLFDAENERERDVVVVAPTMILGAASQIGNIQKAGELRLVGMLYKERGALFAPINEDSYLMVTTSNEALPDVMQTLQRQLPNLTRKTNFSSEKLAINSAIEADQAVRAFFANTRMCDPNHVQMDDAVLNTSEHSWQISGSFRPAHGVRTKRYRIELDARTGAVTKFQTQT